MLLFPVQGVGLQAFEKFHVFVRVERREDDPDIPSYDWTCAAHAPLFSVNVYTASIFAGVLTVTFCWQPTVPDEQVVIT